MTFPTDAATITVRKSFGICGPAIVVPSYFLGFIFKASSLRGTGGLRRPAAKVRPQPSQLFLGLEFTAIATAPSKPSPSPAGRNGEKGIIAGGCDLIRLSA